MSVNENIKQLYERYIQDVRPIAYDGVVNEEIFKKQAFPTLFLLKDANPEAYEDGNAYVHRDLYNTANTINPKEIRIPSTTWRNVCRWAKIMDSYQSCESDCWTHTGEFDVENMRKYLNNIAVVNIKKTFGKGVNENRDEYNIELADAVKDYFDLVNDEIELINPKVIICGGTFEYILPYYFDDKKERKRAIKQLSSGARYFVISKNGKDRIFLEFEHPGSRTSPKILFAYFKETYTALVEKYRNL